MFFCIWNFLENNRIKRNDFCSKKFSFYLPLYTLHIVSPKKIFSMKKLLMLFAAALIFSTAVHAQDTAKNKSMTKGSTTHMKDCYMMKNGKMVMEKNGTTSDMTQDVTLSNGTVVMKDGTVKTKEGKTITMKDGQCVYTDGKIKTMSSMSSSSSRKKPQ